MPHARRTRGADHPGLRCHGSPAHPRRGPGPDNRRAVRGAPPGPIPSGAPGLETGVLSLDAAGTIVQSLAPALDHGAAHADVSAAEDALVSAATGWDGVDRDRAKPENSPPTLTADDIAVMANAWGLALDPDGSLPDERSGLRRRGLTLGRERGGTVPLRGELLPDVAAQLQRIFDAYLNPRVDADPDSAGVAPAQSPMEDATENEPRDHRSPTQRRHDALAGVLTIAAAHDQAPRLGGTAPTLVVTASIDQLSDPSGGAFLQGADNPTQSAVGVHVAQHMGCSGTVQKILLGTGGAILGLTTPQRIFTPHQRRAIALRDGERVIPGCHVPSTWCEVHHVHEHAHGGPTHTSNGALLCWYHHRSLDRSGWKIEMRQGLPWVRPFTWIDPFSRWRPARPAADVHRRVIRATTRSRDRTSRDGTSRDRTSRRGPATRAAGDNRTDTERYLLHDQDTGPPAPA